MSSKALLYLIIAIITTYSLDSINITKIFKKNKEMQARIFYLLLDLSIIYLITNFIWDFFLTTKIN